MPKQPDWPSRDTYVVLEALTFAIEAFERLPIEFRPERSISDMKRLVDGLVRHDVTLAQAQSLALRRLEVIANGKAVPRSR